MADNRRAVTITQAPGRYRVRIFDQKGNVVGEHWCEFSDTAMELAEKLKADHKMMDVLPKVVKFGMDV